MFTSFCVFQVIDSPDAPAPESSEGIVGALMSVMQKRSKAIHSSGKYWSINCSQRRGRVEGKGPTRVCICPLRQMKVKMMVGMTMKTTTNGTTDEVCVDFELIEFLIVILEFQV